MTADRPASYGAVVAVLDAEGTPRGAGFLAGAAQVVTCAHVVTAAGSGPGGEIRLSFPHLPGAPRVSARIDRRAWRPADEEDVAVLELAEVPAAAAVLPLASASGCQGRRVAAYGFPAGAPGGRYGYALAGHVLPADGRGRLLQLREANDVTVGFSGAPVVDEVTGSAIGMVTEITGVDQYQRGSGVAYATAAETLRETHPALVEDSRPPYRGLVSFTGEDRAWFHGRDEVVGRVLAGLARRAVLLIGPSGSGKSSLVQAGVLPALADGPDAWRVFSVRPGSDLLAELDRAGLAGARSGDLVAAVRRHAGGGRLLIVVDQVEELFVESGRRGRARDALTRLEVAVRELPALAVVLVLRDDFYPQLAAAAPGLLDALTPGLVNVPATLHRDDLRAIATRPAASVGLRFEPGLVDQIVADLDAAGPDAPVTVLPLVQLTLLRLWEQRADGWLTHEAYWRIGRVTGGLTATCDQALADLPAEQRPVARRMLTALVRPADPERHVPAVRRRLPLDELRVLAGGAEAGGVDAVLRALTTTTPLIVTSGATAELAHDALIRDWVALRDWVAEDSRFHDWLGRAEERQRRWGTSGEAADLLQGSDLADGIRWSGERRLPAAIGVLLAASRNADQARVRKARLVAAVMTVLFLVVAGTAAVVYAQRQAAVEAQLTALSRQLAAQSQIQAPGNPDLSALLAVHAYRTSPTREALTGLDAAASALRPLRRTLTAHTSAVRAVAFGGHGRLLATAGRDQSVRLWDTTTGRAERTLVANTDLWSVAFSPDGRTVAAAGGDHAVRLWDVATGRVRATLTGHTGLVRAVAFSPDGRTLASAGDDGTVRLWAPATGRTRLTLGHDGAVNAVTFAPDGRTLATASGDAPVRLWDVATGRSRRSLAHGAHAVKAVAFSPDGRTIALANGDATVRLRDVATGRDRATLAGHTDTVNGVAFSPDGRTVVTGGDDRTVRLWDAATGTGKATWLRHSAAVDAVGFSPDGRTLATVGDDATVRLWSLAAGAARATLTGHADVRSVAFGPDGRTLATGAGDDTVRLWDVATGRAGAVLTGHGDTVDAVTFSPDGRTVASSGEDGTVRLWDTATGRLRRTLAGRAGVRSVAFSPDGAMLAGAAGNQVPLWDVATGRRTATLTGHTDSVLSVAFSPDGGTLAGAGSDATVRLWEVETGTVESVLTVNGYAVNAVAFSPDGTRLATAGSDATVRLWDVATGRTTNVLAANSYAVNAVAFSPDGRTVAAAGDDDTARLWDVATGTGKATLTGHTSPLNAVAFSPDGRTVATAGGDHTARLWAFTLPDPVAVADQICAAIGHEISAEEYALYLPGQPATPACR